jgi:GntR family transcriptional regulator, galactonate operon transcriptional repressor
LSNLPNGQKKPKHYSRRRLYHDVVDELGLRIVRGEYAAGDILPGEESLVEELGVSRTVIREAIKVLTEKGLVQPRPKSGTHIHPRAHWHLLDSDVLNWELISGRKVELLRKVTEARRIIEPEAAALAATRGTPDEIELITDAYYDMERHVEDIAGYIEADMIFHSGILKACHNEILEQMAATMRRGLVASREVTTRDASSSAGALPLHLAVLSAIRNRDSQAAYDAMRYLVDRAGADIERIVGEPKDS